MGNFWLPGLAGWLRSAGLDVIEYPGWEKRSRSSGGFDRVMGIGVHHDASAIGRSGQRAADAHWLHHADKPVGNLALDRHGVWWVGAAGASNTQGKGGPFNTSQGVMPLDRGNQNTIAIECGNNGVGEVWPQRQTDSLVRGVAAIILGLAIDGALDKRTGTFSQVRLVPSDVFGHFEWAPTRKIDPAGPSPWCDEADRHMRWHMGAFRADVASALNPKGAIVEVVKFAAAGSSYAPGVVPLWQITGPVIRWLSPEAWAALGSPQPTRTLSADEARRLVLVGPSPEGCAPFARQVA